MHLVVVLDLPLHALRVEGDEPQAVREHLVGEDRRVFGNLDLVNGERVDARDHAPSERVGEAVGGCSAGVSVRGSEGRLERTRLTRGGRRRG